MQKFSVGGVTVNLVKLVTDKTLDFYYMSLQVTSVKGFVATNAPLSPLPVASFTKLTV